MRISLFQLILLIFLFFLLFKFNPRVTNFLFELFNNFFKNTKKNNSNKNKINN